MLQQELPLPRLYGRPASIPQDFLPERHHTWSFCSFRVKSNPQVQAAVETSWSEISRELTLLILTQKKNKRYLYHDVLSSTAGAEKLRLTIYPSETIATPHVTTGGPIRLGNGCPLLRQPITE